MADIEFFFDPMCPWAWITSRFAVEVSELRELAIEWRFISLAIVNEAKFIADEEAVAAGREPTLPAAYKSMTELGLKLHRVAAAVKENLGNEAVGRFYTSLGEIIHKGGASARLWQGEDPGDVLNEGLEKSGLSADFAVHATDETWDRVLRADTETALSRTGDDVGTPIITFDLDRPDEASLFGPVINRIPRGQEALELWGAVELIAKTPGIAEFKRSLRASPVFD